MNRHYIWLYRMLVNNGLAFYATWVTIATFVNLTIAISYKWSNTSTVTSSIISLSIITVVSYY
jgi:hypothetical protein